jgi:hypothetical protein
MRDACAKGRRTHGAKVVLSSLWTEVWRFRFMRGVDHTGTLRDLPPYLQVHPQR